VRAEAIARTAQPIFFKESPMRKSILMFIAATIASAAVSSPATALDRNTCDPNLRICMDGCYSAYVPWDPNFKAYCLAGCKSIHRKCSIKHEVTIPVPGWTTPPKFPVINRPPKAESPIRSGGILDSITGMGGQGPSATGSPISGGSRAPSPPPVIIR
jgi:hypothetical protein